jgi:Domain of unknown function (DUF4160)
MAASSLSALAKQLQSKLASAQPRVGDRRPSKGFNAYLLRKVERIKLKMYQEKGHACPHLHVDYGAEHHCASFAIDPPRRLSGKLPAREEATVLAWIASNKRNLLSAWKGFQDGEPNASLLAELRSGA